MAKIIIFGTRTFDSRVITYKMLCDLIADSGFTVTEVVSGTNGHIKKNGRVVGVDKMGEVWAIRNGISVTPFRPEWRLPSGEQDLEAGFKRNTLMADYGDCGACFWDGSSSGTRDMFEKLISRRKPVLIRVVRNGIVYDRVSLESIF